MWTENSTVYQIYPLGFCDAPKENDGVEVNRIQKIQEWIPHFKELRVDAILLNPVFDSDRHGYDTRDYRIIDPRLGTNEAFQEVCNVLHQAKIKIILDGVFNHVGRGFWAFQDVRKNRQQSQYKDWFYINFSGEDGYQDGFSYEGWEGHYELVKLNLKNPEVVNHLFSCVKEWIDEFGIEGLRLDVAYCLDHDFIKDLHSFVKDINPEFVLIGEILFGDYKRIVNPLMLDSCTNYECYKGIYSSLNDVNLFEISYSLNRQFASDQGAIYRGLSLMNFVDNHDVSRIYSILQNKEHLKIAYGILFTMPGFPCLYYGSEWGAKGDKKAGDDALRSCYEEPIENELTEWIAQLAKVRKNSDALSKGSYRNLKITNPQLVYERVFKEERVIVAMNIGKEDKELTLNLGEDSLPAFDLINEVPVILNNQMVLEKNGFYLFLVQKDEEISSLEVE